MATKKKNIIDVLRDDNEYYRGEGLKYFSNSSIKALLENPKEFGKVEDDNKAFMEGRYFHVSILEPEKLSQIPVVDASTRNTKIYKDFLTDNNIELALLTSEAEEMASLASAILHNPVFYDDIFADGNKFEEPAVCDILGYPFKGKADIVTDEFVIDLKTTSDITQFKWNARKYNYDSQAYIYQELFGKPLYFMAADKKTQMLGIFKPTQDFIDSGKEKVIKALEVWEKFFGPNATDDVGTYYIESFL